MAQFIGTHQNKLDAKGRVSIPAQFRSVLKQMSYAGEGPWSRRWCCVRRISNPCIEGWTERVSRRSARRRGRLQQFSPEHEDFVAGAVRRRLPAETDKEGRIMLPAGLAAHAGLSENVMFIGYTRRFRSGNP